MLLADLSVAFSQGDDCKIVQVGIRNAGKETFKTPVINIILSKLTIDFRCHFIGRSCFVCFFISGQFRDVF